jgi:hypothetical protein
MKTNSDNLNFLQAAAASGYDQGDFSKLVHRTGFVGRKGKHNERLINRDELAQLTGRRLSDEAFARARLVRAKSASKEKEAALNTMLRQTLDAWAPHDPGYARAAVEARDQEWRTQLLGKGLTGWRTPPMPAKLVPDLSSHFIFSREAVEILIANAVREHHADWFQWKLDPVARAQFPDGPKLNTGEMT